jgi:excisionase family DNA binding protein
VPYKPGLYLTTQRCTFPYQEILYGGVSVPNDDRETLKVGEVAATLRCGRNQAYELVRSGAIRSVRIGRAIRIPREALEAFMTGQEAAERAQRA